MKFFILYVFVTIGLFAVAYAQNIYGENEEPCSRVGGRCIYKEYCEHFAEESGLCPKQQESGYECCYGYPKGEYRCKELGGQCFKSPYCKNPNLNATDCARGEECCILL